MEPRIVTHPPLQVVGLQITTTPMSPEIPALWPRFMDRVPELEPLLEPQVSYGVMQMVPGEPVRLIYQAAVSVPSAGKVPDGMTAQTLPGGLHAVFEFPLSDMGASFGFILGTWLPASGYEQAASPLYERYNEHFNPENPKSLVEAHIPIRPRNGKA